MNEYIFYAKQGGAPRGDFGAEQCRVLGTACGGDVEEARKRLLADNPWIEAAGFSSGEVVARQLITGTQQADLKTLVEYLWQDEARHYEEANRPAAHIFEVLRRLCAMV